MTTERPRLQMFVHTLDDRAVSRLLRAIVPPLQALGAEVSLIHATTDPSSRLVLPDGIEVHGLGLGTRPTALGIPRLARLLRRTRPDVLFAHLNGPSRAAILARVLSRTATAVVPVEHTHYSTFYRRRRWIRDPLTRLLYQRADLVAGVSQGVVDELVSLFPGIAGRTVVLPSVGPDAIAVREALASEPDHAWYRARPAARVICCVANVLPRKGQATLVEALPLLRSRLGDVRLLLVGRIEDEPFARRLEQRAGELGVGEALALVGYQERPLPFIAHADVFALASTTEGAPMVLVEALACGVPVVSTDCPVGPRELLADGRYGELVPVGDHVALAEGIARIVLDGRLRARRVEAGRERARAFTPAAVAEVYMAIAKRTMARAPAPEGQRRRP